MKRVPAYKKPEYGIEEIKTWIWWKECTICGKEVRREKLWAILIDCYDEFNEYQYACKDCLPTIEKAIEYRTKEIKRRGYV